MTEPRPLRAAVWMTGAIAAFTSMAIAGRAAARELDTFELMTYRSLIGLAIMSVVVAAGRRSVATRRLPLHLLRNLSHFAGQNLWFAAVTMIPLATLFALEFTSPIWVVILAALTLGERLTPARVAALALGFAGAMVVARPWAAGPADGAGLALAALAAVGFAGSLVATKALTRSDGIIRILFWMTATQTVFGLACAGWDADMAWPSTPMWGWVAVVGLAGLVAHTCLTTALSLAPATQVVPMDFLRLPVIALVGAAFYAEPLEPAVFLGAALIFLGVWLTLRRGRAPA